MIIKKINEQDFENFMSKSSLSSFYQSIEWKIIKEKENKKCELIGIYDNNSLVGVSLIIYTKILKKYYMAYASRGLVYDYSNIKELKVALREYFKNKNVVMLRIDPNIILATYDKKLIREENVDNTKLINILKENGFIHFGFNTAFEAMQFRFVHRLELKGTYEEQLLEMSKSTRKNIELAKFKGVNIKQVTNNELDEVYRLFDETVDRKKIYGFKKEFYENIINSFNNTKMYIAYIDKNEYIKNLNNKLNEIEQDLLILKEKLKKYNVGEKLKKQEEQLLNSKLKYENNLLEAKSLQEYTNIASMLTITKYDEVVSFVSGMDNKYRSFCPKYVMYPEMIKDAIKEKLKYVNFLGVKNIFDKNDPDYGMYEVKKGFGGKTIEYIGEFDLPINNTLYKLYKIIKKIRRG